MKDLNSSRSSFRNVELHGPLPLSGWRKISMGSWRPTGDSAIHTSLSLSLEPFFKARRQGQSLNFLIAKLVSLALLEVPQVNSVVRLGRIQPRKHADVFFHVLRDGGVDDDLCGIRLETPATKSIDAIGHEFKHKIARVRDGNDPDFRNIKNNFRRCPGWLARLALNITGFLTFTLNLSNRLVGAPRDCFTAAMISNIGAFDIGAAYIPLAPYTRSNVAISIGKAERKPWVVGDQIEVHRVLNLGFTFDHRVADGIHCGRFLKVIEDGLRCPEKYLGPKEPDSPAPLTQADSPQNQEQAPHA